MTDEFIPREIPRVRVALFGPSNTGKTTFCNMLTQHEISKIEPTESARIIEILRDYKRRTVMGTYETVTKYKLTLVDVPGREEFKEQRTKSLTKIVAWIFFYDATDPTSAENLQRMIREELEKERMLKSAIAMIVVGTKSDLGPDPRAVKIGEEIAKHLSKKTSSLYGYEVPHFLISCLDSEDVNLAFLCIERINFELKLPEDLISKLKRKMEKYLEKPPIEKPVPPKIIEQKIEEEQQITAIETPPEAPTEEIKEGEIPIPPLPKLPEGAEKQLEKLRMEIPPEEPIPEPPVEIPLEETPQVLKEAEIKAEAPKIEKVEAPPHTEEHVEIEITPKESLIGKEIPPPEAPHRLIELCETDFDWALANSLYSRIGPYSKIYVVDVKPDKLVVAYDNRERELGKDEEKLLLGLLDAVSISETITERPKAMLIISEKLHAIIRGRKLLIIQASNSIIREVCSILASLRSSGQETSLAVSSRYAALDISLEITKQKTLIGLARNLQQKIRGVSSCFILISTNRKIEVAYSDQKNLSKKQIGLLEKILTLSKTIDEAIGKHRVVIIYGLYESIMILNGDKGLLILAFTEQSPSSLISVISKVA